MKKTKYKARNSSLRRKPESRLFTWIPTFAGKTVVLGIFFSALSPRLASANLTARGVAVYDLNGTPRTSFTNTEKLILQQTVSNAVSSLSRINFTFRILSPTGAKVFEQYGNAAPGSVGNAQTQVSGVPISQFYTQPGNYTCVALAELAGEVVQQQLNFLISSPNINLVYPPNGATNLTDSPLIFRWVGSGAVNYRISVDISPSFYYATFSQTTGDTSFSYPINPTDSRQQLTAGQVYYWKVEGLDTNGNKISDSGPAFSFSVKGQAATLARDLAVTDLSIVPPATSATQGPIPFKVSIANQGGTTEANVLLKFTVGGLPAPESPQTVSLGPGSAQQFVFHAGIPADQTQSLAIACLELFDDNVTNNCKTMQIAGSAGSGSGVAGSTSAVGNYGMDQAWQILQNALGSGDIQAALQGYQLVEINGQSQQDVNSTLNDISKGAAKVSAPTPPQALTPPGGSAGPDSNPAAMLPQQAPTDVPLSNEAPPEWADRTNYTAPLTKHIVIRDQDAWEKLWKNISKDPVPKVDFKQFMMVGVIAGSEDRAELIQIKDVKMEEYSMRIRYMLATNKKKSTRAVPYHFKAIPKSDTHVDFELMSDQ